MEKIKLLNKEINGRVDKRKEDILVETKFFEMEENAAMSSA